MNIDNKSQRNQTIELSQLDYQKLSNKIMKLDSIVSKENLINKTICQDIFSALDFIPDSIFDLIFIDPPYNLNKSFGETKFKSQSIKNYQSWIELWLSKVVDKLKEGGSLYICGDWKSSAPIQNVLDELLIIQNRITFEREKGRGAKSNWKNCSEDIWFATKGNSYVFNVEDVKIKRNVNAPYKKQGMPKDWTESNDGNYRLTYPSNIWTDLTIPFWSMPENTKHSTQKPEKLLAKIILASSNKEDFIFDPFLGSGTTSVVAKKLGRKYCGIDINKEYCLLTEKRLEIAEKQTTIQGYEDGVFYDRNFKK